jgi:hypothetical protein
VDDGRPGQAESGSGSGSGSGHVIRGGAFDTGLERLIDDRGRRRMRAVDVTRGQGDDPLRKRVPKVSSARTQAPAITEWNDARNLGQLFVHLRAAHGP